MADLMIDTLIGSIPDFGDACDFAFNAKLKKLRQSPVRRSAT